MPSSPSSSSDSEDPVPAGYVRLILMYTEDSPFYLQIPLDIIASLCLKPRKYLIFLGWCVFGIEGGLASNPGGEMIEEDGDLADKGTYYFVAPEGIDFSWAVDLEVIKQRTDAPSETTQTREDFRKDLLDRDVCCVWTGLDPEIGSGIHIIPYTRGSEWVQLIVENRPQYGEDVTLLSDINAIGNGVFTNDLIHKLFDLRKLVILKTPNPILDMEDIHRCHEQPVISENVAYPAYQRYTLQWLVAPYGNPTIPHNGDAAFKNETTKPKPSDLLLHYNYGAAAVKHWGSGIQTFKLRTNPPRPSIPIAASMGPQKTIHDRNIAIQKRNAGRDADGVGASNSMAGAGTREMVDSEWDEDDMMLFLWGNSKAATERHHEKQKESTQYVEQWRAGVNPVLV